MRKVYFIEVEVIKDNCKTLITPDYNIPKIGETFYLHPQFITCNCERFTDDINGAACFYDFNQVKEVAIKLYKRGNVIPHIKEVIRNIGDEIHIDYENAD